MTRRWLSLSLIFLAGCSSAKQGRMPGHYVDRITVGGLQREYILRIPKGYVVGKSTPVVIGLHGLSGSMDQFAATTKIEEVADREGFICAIPNGLQPDMRGWNTGFFALAGAPSDSEFIKTILDKVESEFSVDKKREYVFGHSNGAMMAYALGGSMSDRLAAVAGIAGTIGIPRGKAASLAVPAPKFPISVLMIHGQKDNMVAYKPGDRALLQCTGAEEGAMWWAKQDGCDAKPTVSDFVKDYAQLTDYKNGKNGTEVKLISTFNGTHQVPGGWFGQRQESASGVDAVKEIWNFFKAHSKN